MNYSKPAANCARQVTFLHLPCRNRSIASINAAEHAMRHGFFGPPLARAPVRFRRPEDVNNPNHEHPFELDVMSEMDRPSKLIPFKETGGHVNAAAR
ncbi:hypothetical protein [Bradyrhizobium centrolobii]|uniref:hypothetical protein n=1 Tax=Bradyrhizobium centrolobii TaxID=1505087 RepID=UPI000A6FC790|nr:hypothetical protein [Bradyrhizobium centrolobii]